MIFDPKDGRDHLGPGWSAQISQLHEDAPMHPITLRMAERGYSVEVVIDAPDDARVEWTVED